MPFLATTNTTPYLRQTRKLLEEQSTAAQAKRERNFKIMFCIGLPTAVLVGSFIFAVIVF